MDINRNNGILYIDMQILPENGVIFLYCSWSKSLLYLKYLVSILDKYPKVDLYVYDIDKDMYNNIKGKYNIVSHGKGETLWIKNSEILYAVIDYEKEKEYIETYINDLNDKL